MNLSSHSMDAVPPIRHAEAMTLAAAENLRLLALLDQISDDDWSSETDCTRWTVRDIVVHLIGSAQGQASPVEFFRQVRAGRKLTAEIGGEHWVDGLNEAQLRARTQLSTQSLPAEWDTHAAAALRSRRRMPAPLRALPLLPLGTIMGTRLGWQPLRYLFDVGFTRDVWMHRVDIARATGLAMELTPEHDGRLVADIVAEWSRRHGQPFTLTLTGPAGGTFHSATADPGEALSLDAVEFARILSGRAEGPGVLSHKLPL